MFIAIKGERFDGHAFIKQAIENGAAAAVSEYPVDGCPCIVVKNTRTALLGKNPTMEQIQKFSAELQVTPDTPQAFIALTYDKGNDSSCFIGKI